ncbi:kinase-like protein, partial [Pleomassaria siparia CBS 279.74]
MQNINGSHPNIVQLLGYDKEWSPHAPALFYEYCPLGDAYSHALDVRHDVGFVPEAMIWKLFMDISEALYFLHHCCEPPLIHGDVKPENILVSAPDGGTAWEDEIRFVPQFKLTDFSRTTDYLPGRQADYRFQGTFEYAPP